MVVVVVVVGGGGGGGGRGELEESRRGRRVQSKELIWVRVYHYLFIFNNVGA